MRIFIPFLIPAALPALVLIVIGLLITGDVDVLWFALGSVAGAFGYMIYQELDTNVKD